jgi:hypothetical protein
MTTVRLLSAIDTLPVATLEAATGADITSALEKHFSVYSSGSRLVIPPGAYTANFGALSIPSKTRIEAQPGSATITGVAASATNGYANAVFAIKPGATDITIDGVNFAGPDRWQVAVMARGASNVTLKNISPGNICLFWSQRTARATYDAYSSMSSSNWCKKITIDNCHGTGGAAVSGEGLSAQFIELRYVLGFDVSNCSADSYAHGVQWWGGNSGDTSEAGSDYMSNERKCGYGTITNCRMTTMGGAGVWGSMGKSITVSGCFAKNCLDIGFDPEGSYDIQFIGCTAEDCTNANLSTYYACKRIYYIGCTSRSTSANSYPFLFKSWSVVGSTNRANNRDHKFINCIFECEDGVGLITNDAGGANNLEFTKCTFRNARVDMFDNGAGAGGSGRLNVENNMFIFTIGTTPSIQTGTATAGTSTTLTDSGKTWKVNQWKNCRATITSGTGSGQSRMVNSNTGTALTVSPSWTTAPDATSVYRIEIPAVVIGSNDAGDHYVEGNKIAATTGSYFWAGVVVRHEDGNASRNHYVTGNVITGGFTVASHVEERTSNTANRARVYYERNKIAEGMTWTRDFSQTGGGGTYDPYVYWADNKVIDSTISDPFTRTPAGSATYNPPSISSNSSTTTTVTIPGLRSYHKVGCYHSAIDATALIMKAAYSSADTATITIYNNTGHGPAYADTPIDAGSATLYAWIDGERY